MSAGEDIDDLPPGGEDAALAAEYVLRLLDPAEEAACVTREATDRGFAEQAERWRDDFAELDAAFAPVAPPAAILARVEARIFPEAPRPSALARLWASAGLWRSLAAVATVVAVYLGVTTLRPAGETDLVAAMAPREGGGEFVVRFDPEDGTVALTRLAGDAAAGRVLQLWALVDQAPVSLGVLPEDPEVELTLPPELAARLGDGTLVEVTEEPAGGSPGPTGTVFAIGYLRDV